MATLLQVVLEHGKVLQQSPISNTCIALLIHAWMQAADEAASVQERATLSLLASMRCSQVRRPWAERTYERFPGPRFLNESPYTHTLCSRSHRWQTSVWD
jgi:hypothetical protein